MIELKKQEYAYNSSIFPFPSEPLSDTIPSELYDKAANWEKNTTKFYFNSDSNKESSSGMPKIEDKRILF